MAGHLMIMRGWWVWAGGAGVVGYVVAAVLLFRSVPWLMAGVVALACGGVAVLAAWVYQRVVPRGRRWGRMVVAVGVHVAVGVPVMVLLGDVVPGLGGAIGGVGGPVFWAAWDAGDRA
ncbi:hypothetical protein Aglo03_35180 [Actinokineospora globicatena]|uniref:Uncharacterized protein n=1 Tax=Actinokineospora globicatena TaxID=103729 RepID=A0A9W6V8U8_9PSEU|nr:hypothetical protein Aglo03_35180 [Actinokineospora globicatena]